MRVAPPTKTAADEQRLDEEHHRDDHGEAEEPVSYTHLTLPTSDLV